MKYIKLSNEPSDSTVRKNSKQVICYPIDNLKFSNMSIFQKARKYLEVIEDRYTKELKFQNKDGKYSMLSLPGTQKWQKDKKTAEPGTDKWFKTFKTLPYLTKGRKNHYMLPIKKKISELENLLKEYGVIKKDK